MEGGDPTLCQEHDEWAWLPLAVARERVSWPRLRRGMDQVEELLAEDAGDLEDVLRIE